MRGLAMLVLVWAAVVRRTSQAEDDLALAVSARADASAVEYADLDASLKGKGPKSPTSYADNEHCRAELAGHSDGTVVTPLGIPAYAGSVAFAGLDIGGDGERTEQLLRFKFTARKKAQQQVQEMAAAAVARGAEPPALSLRVTSRRGRAVLVDRPITEEWQAVGEDRVFDWRWDGFSDAGALDTRDLKAGVDVELRLEGLVLCGLRARGAPAKADWLDVTLDKRTKTAEVEWRVQFDDGGASGVSEPLADWALKEADGIAALGCSTCQQRADQLKQKPARERTFAQLEKLAVEGIEEKWSRAGPERFVHAGGRSEGEQWSLRVKARVVPDGSAEPHMDDLDLTYNTNNDWMRPSNAGSVSGIGSLFAQFAPERLSYNVGWIRTEWGGSVSVEHVEVSKADHRFKEVAAHEVGHEVLKEYGGELYSGTHKGTSTIGVQSTKSARDGGEGFPAEGEVDVMKYYDYQNAVNICYPSSRSGSDEWKAKCRARSEDECEKDPRSASSCTWGSPNYRYGADEVVAEVDAASLLWLARVEMAA